MAWIPRNSGFWKRPLASGLATGAAIGFLNGSGLFDFGPLSYAGKIFTALLVQPPLTLWLLAGCAFLAGLRRGVRRPFWGIWDGLALLVGVLAGGFLAGGLIRSIAGPTTMQKSGVPATVGFIRVFLFEAAQVLLWGGAGLAFGRIRGKSTDTRKSLAIAGGVLLVAIGSQHILFSVAFPGGV